MGSFARGLVVFVALVLMIVVLVSVGAAAMVRVTALNRQFWTDLADIALDAERLVPVVDATEAAESTLEAGQEGIISFAHVLLILLDIPERPVQESAQRYVDTVFRYLDGRASVEQVEPLFSAQAVNDFAAAIDSGFQRGRFEGIEGLRPLRGLSSVDRRRAIEQMIDSLQEALDYHKVPLRITGRSDPATLEQLRSIYLQQRSRSNRALFTGIMALFVLVGLVLVAWKSDPIRGLRRVGIAFLVSGVLALAVYAAVRFLGPSLIERALRELVEQPEVSGAQTETIIVWMTQVHRYLATIYLRALRPFLVMAAIATTSGLGLLLLPRLGFDAEVRSMTPE